MGFVVRPRKTEVFSPGLCKLGGRRQVLLADFLAQP